MAAPLAALAPYAISAIPAMFQGISGLIQNKRGKDAAENIVRPTATVPKGALDALSLSQTLAGNMKFAGQDLAEESLDENFAQAIQSIQEGSSSAPEALSAIVAASANRSRAQQGLAEFGATDYARRQGDVTQRLEEVAYWQDKADQWNKRDKYAEDVNYANAMIGAGNENIFGSLNTLGGIGANVLGSGILNKAASGTAQDGSGFDLSALTQEQQSWLKGLESNPQMKQSLFDAMFRGIGKAV